MPKNPHRGILRGNGLTKTQRLYFERMRIYAAQMNEEDVTDYDVEVDVPDAWQTLEQDTDVDEKKVKITLRVDESVAKFYRAMGTGYQARINRILATFAQMRMAQAKQLNAKLEVDRQMIRENVKADPNYCRSEPS